jgi:hypothetical protein
MPSLRLPSLRSPSCVNARLGRRSIALLLGLLALFSMAVLTSWHEMHPDLHVDDVSISASVDHSDHGGEGGAKDPDHIAAHAGLHGVGLPAAYGVTIAPLTAAASWLIEASRLLVMSPLFSILRPPRD